MPPTPVSANKPPPHLAHWHLPPEWRWGADAVREDFRHFQEVVDALGRSLALVTAPNAAHAAWLHTEARQLAHRNHPAIPTTYHYWAPDGDAPRGPGYLRRWIVGETLAARVARQGPQDVPLVLRLLREAGGVAAYLHDTGTVHGALVGQTLWLTPSGRIWLLGWQWATPRDAIPSDIIPDTERVPPAPEWLAGTWEPTALSDQWQLGALAFLALTGELPPSADPPPIALLRPDCPASAAAVIDRALHPDPARRHGSVVAMVRALDRGVSLRGPILSSEADAPDEEPEARLRWATGDDYEILSPLGSGTFGSVWRVRDLALGREVALKALHPHIARDGNAVARFRREAQLAAQLAHTSIVPIYDFDTRGSVSWYTMELAEAGSVADLIRRSGARPPADVLPQIDPLLEGLAAAHAIGVIHRDLKPENVLIDRYGHWRLSDFGIASALGEEVAGSSGTPAFAPPEQLLGEPQGPAADCYAFAAIVYFVLVGTPPFGDVEAPTILARQLGGELTFDGIEPAIVDWLRRGLAMNAEDRFADAAEMQTAWHDAMRSVTRASEWQGLLRRIFA